MKETLAGLFLIAVLVIAFMHERVKELKYKVEVMTPKSHIPPFSADRMMAAQLDWSKQMTRIDRAEGQDNWAYRYAERQFAAASAALINNMEDN